MMKLDLTYIPRLISEWRMLQSYFFSLIEISSTSKIRVTFGPI